MDHVRNFIFLAGVGRGLKWIKLMRTGRSANCEALCANLTQKCWHTNVRLTCGQIPQSPLCVAQQIGFCRREVRWRGVPQVCGLSSWRNFILGHFRWARHNRSGVSVQCPCKNFRRITSEVCDSCSWKRNGAAERRFLMFLALISRQTQKLLVVTGGIWSSLLGTSMEFGPGLRWVTPGRNAEWKQSSVENSGCLVKLVSKTTTVIEVQCQVCVGNDALSKQDDFDRFRKMVSRTSYMNARILSAFKKQNVTKTVCQTKSNWTDITVTGCLVTRTATLESGCTPRTSQSMSRTESVRNSTWKRFTHFEFNFVSTDSESSWHVTDSIARTSEARQGGKSHNSWVRQILLRHCLWVDPGCVCWQQRGSVAKPCGETCDVKFLLSTVVICFVWFRNEWN